ncbi:MAG: flagellar hook-length control protein FliK [Variovorax sp.]
MHTAQTGEGPDAPDANVQPASDKGDGVAASATTPPSAAATDAMRVQAAYGWSAPAPPAPSAAAAFASDAAPAQLADEAARSGASSAAAPAPAAAEVIHPQGATVVHQQLDLLATAVFRWSGHAWPDVPMDWSIREEADDAHADTDASDAERPRSWSTTVSLVLPRLGAVDLRLSLTGAVVQAQVTALETATLSRLQTGRGGLARRLEAAGLHLQALQIDAMAAAASREAHA